MALPTTPEEWVSFLARLHDQDVTQLRELNDLYEGTAPLAYLHPDLLREVAPRIQVVSLGWPMLAVDPLEERLDMLGFRVPEDDDVDPDADPEELASYAGDKDLQRVWQDNDLDEESQMAHVDALVMKRAYITVGTNEDDADTPLVSVESPLEMFAYIDPRTRKVLGALRRWRDDDSVVRVRERFATLYLPDATIWWSNGGRGWVEDDRDEHHLGEVPVVPLTNRARIADRYGRSELTPPMLSLSHAANKIATDMMVAAEFHAIPLRALFGIGPEDLEDEAGNRMTALQAIMGKLLTIPDVDGNEVRPHQFDPTTLSNYHQTLDQLAKHASGLLGLDPGNFGITSQNPASAEAMRAREARAVKRAERKQRGFGGPWEKSQRLVKRFQEGDWDPKYRRLEAIWRDAATPTRAQAADAAQKLFAEGITTRRQTREDLGYTPAQIRRMEAEDALDDERLTATKPVAQVPVLGEPGPLEAEPAEMT